MRVLNFGSLNIDHVYQVDHIAEPGETLASRSYQVFAGGKGANQSAALARAGAPVYHAGLVGPEGQWLVDKLSALGADMRHTGRSPEPTGHAVIQVDRQGQNAIVIHPGCNGLITRDAIDVTLGDFGPGDVLLLQNEVSELPHLIRRGRERGMTVCFNPAPFDQDVRDYPIGLVDVLVVNESEARGLAGGGGDLLAGLGARFPTAEIVLTLGSRGARYRSAARELEVAPVAVEAVDSTAAGDTFIGYYLAGVARGMDVVESLAQAARAAALCVGRPGAMDSIPACHEVPGPE